MNIEKTLWWIGLTKNEVTIYLVLLRSGTSKAGKVAQLAKLNRTSTYESLRSLLDKGLISYVVKENHKWFTATDPKRIVEYIAEKKDEAKKILPELEKIYKKPAEPHDVTLYNGYKGIKSVFMDFVREGETISVLDSKVSFEERMPFFVPHYKKAIEKKGIKIKHIAHTDSPINPSKTTEVRRLNLKTLSPVATDIYGDKIAIVIWSKIPEAVIIKNKLAADAYREYFEILWKVAKPQRLPK